MCDWIGWLGWLREWCCEHPPCSIVILAVACILLFLCLRNRSTGSKIAVGVVALVAVVIGGVLFFNYCPSGYGFLHDVVKVETKEGIKEVKEETTKGIKEVKESSVEEENAWLYFITAIGTAALAIIAYTQIKQLITTSSGEFLLHIDERWSSKEILEARTIIHKMYVNTEPFFDPRKNDIQNDMCEDNANNLCQKCQDKRKEILCAKCKEKKMDENNLCHACKECKKRDFCFKCVESEIDSIRCSCKECKEKIKCDRLALKILDMSASRESPQIAEDFIKILNYLDFMESIGYLWENKYVNTDKTKGQEQLDALCGASLIWNYNIARIYIKYKRDKRNNNEYYKNFVSLCYEIGFDKSLSNDKGKKEDFCKQLPYLKSKGKGA